MRGIGAAKFFSAPLISRTKTLRDDERDANAFMLLSLYDRLSFPRVSMGNLPRNLFVAWLKNGRCVEDPRLQIAGMILFFCQAEPDIPS